MDNRESDAAAEAVAKSDHRVSLDMIEQKIADEIYIEADGNTLTICILTLRNGYQVTGQSACADPANYNQEMGRRIARENAVKQVWPLEGYLLRERLHCSPHLADAASFVSWLANRRDTEISEVADPGEFWRKIVTEARQHAGKSPA